MKNKLYEFECQRNNVTPKEFFNYCRKQAEKKNVDITTWIDDFETWENPLQKEEYHTNNHEDWEEPLKESIKIMSYNLHLFFQNNYNIIMEFEFCTETKGYGYCYMMEYER